LAFRRFARNHDVILSYRKSDKWTWTSCFLKHGGAYAEKFYRHQDPDGRRYALDNLLNPNKNRPNLTYEYLGVSRVWRWTRERMLKAFEDGRILQSAPGGVPRFKRYLDEQEGTPIGDVWTDIRPVQSGAKEALGYPTQKPLALLERILSASSRVGDVVLDPFCGCGTSVHAAEKLERRWVAIDSSPVAVGLVQRRLAEAFPDCEFATIGTPRPRVDESLLGRAEREAHDREGNLAL
jgi:site-specific DNA-methyltransferase (adenine-specific)